MFALDWNTLLSKALSGWQEFLETLVIRAPEDERLKVLLDESVKFGSGARKASKSKAGKSAKKKTKKGARKTTKAVPSRSEKKAVKRASKKKVTKTAKKSVRKGRKTAK